MDLVSSSKAGREEATRRISELMAQLIGQAVLYNEQVARALGISAVDLQTFGVISRHAGSMTPGEVATRTALPASTTTRVLDRLEAAGYIVRSAFPEDRRKVAVTVVAEKAMEVARRYGAKIDEIRALNDARSDAELDTVISYLSGLAGEGRS